jgi:hypothetical protein
MIAPRFSLLFLLGVITVLCVAINSSREYVLKPPNEIEQFRIYVGRYPCATCTLSLYGKDPYFRSLPTIQIETGARDVNGRWTGVILLYDEAQSRVDRKLVREITHEIDKIKFQAVEDYRPLGGIRLYVFNKSSSAKVVDLNVSDSRDWFDSRLRLHAPSSFVDFWNNTLRAKYLPELTAF